MARFRKKPVEVEATQWFKNGDHPDDYTNEHYVSPTESYSPDYRREHGWEGNVVRYFRRPEPEYAGESVHEPCGRAWDEHGWIDTLEGGHTVCPGDWIITGVQGERYPCKPDIFAITYDSVMDVPTEAVPRESKMPSFVIEDDGSPDMISSAVFQALAYASMCWSETPRGIFESDAAKDCGDTLINYLNDKM